MNTVTKHRLRLINKYHPTPISITCSKALKNYSGTFSFFPEETKQPPATSTVNKLRKTDPARMQHDNGSFRRRILYDIPFCIVDDIVRDTVSYTGNTGNDTFLIMHERR